jgi:hypothetical protein
MKKLSEQLDGKLEIINDHELFVNVQVGDFS